MKMISNSNTWFNFQFIFSWQPHVCVMVFSFFLFFKGKSISIWDRQKNSLCWVGNLKAENYRDKTSRYMITMEYGESKKSPFAWQK